MTYPRDVHLNSVCVSTQKRGSFSRADPPDPIILISETTFGRIDQEKKKKVILVLFLKGLSLMLLLIESPFVTSLD